jgi:AcrR family transcriptional regulator
MVEPGLRELKKARTRHLIAATAARLFAERGYDNVAVRDVAREAEVAEQTVYNYFPTKEQLVTDREQQVQDRLCELIRLRSAIATPAAAVRDFLLESVTRIGEIPADEWRGELGYLAAISTSVYRLSLELVDRLAAALAGAIGETSTVAPEIAKLEGIALAGVLQIIISESGQRTVAGHRQAEIVEGLSAEVEHILDELDYWFRSSPRPLRQTPRSGRART